MEMNDEERRDRATKVATVVIQSLPYDEKNPETTGYQILNTRGRETSDEAFARAAKEHWRDFTLHGKMEIQDGKPVVVGNTDLDARIAKQLLNVAEIGKVRIEEKGKFLRIDSKDITYIQPGEWVEGKSKILRIKENGKERKIEATKITKLPPGKHSKEGEEKVQIDLKDTVKIVDVKEIKYVKQGDWNEGSTNIDTSGGNKTQIREGTKGEYKVIEPYSGKNEIDLSKDKIYTLVFDHHSPESLNDTSATEELYKTLIAAKLIKETPQLNKLVEFVTQIDNSTFPDSYKYFKRSNRMLLGLYRYFTTEKLVTFFEGNRKPTEELSDFDLELYSGKSFAKIPIEEEKPTESSPAETAASAEPAATPGEVKPKEVKTKNVPYLIAKSLDVEKKIKQSEQDLANMEDNGFVVRTAGYGITVIDVVGEQSKLPLGWEAVKARYYIPDRHNPSPTVTLIRWDPKNNGFFVTSTRDLDFYLPQGEKVRRKMYVKNRDEVPVNFKLAELLKKVRIKDIELGLKEYLDNEAKPVEKPVEKSAEKTAEEPVKKKVESPLQNFEEIPLQPGFQLEKTEGTKRSPKNKKGKPEETRGSEEPGEPGKTTKGKKPRFHENNEPIGQVEPSGSKESAVVLDKYFNNTQTPEPENPVLTQEDIARFNAHKNEPPVSTEELPEENAPAEAPVQEEPALEIMPEEVPLDEKDVTEKAQKMLEEMKRDGLIVKYPEKDEKGNTVYKTIVVDIDEKLPGGWKAAREAGNNTYVMWKPGENRFVIEGDHPLNISFPQGTTVDPSKYVKPHGDEPLDEDLADILYALTGGRYEKRGELKEYLDKEAGISSTPVRIIRDDFDLKDYFDELKRRENLPKAPEVPVVTPVSTNPYAIEPETAPGRNPTGPLHVNRKPVRLIINPSEVKTSDLSTEQKIYQKRQKLRSQKRGNTP